MKLAKQIEALAGNWPEWFRDQVVSLGEWRRGWPEGGVVVPPDVPPRRIRSTFWVPPRVSIFGDERRGRRDYKQAFLTATEEFELGRPILRVMKSPKKDGTEKKGGNANFNQGLENLLFSCNDRAVGPIFYGAQCSAVEKVRVKNPRAYGFYLGYGSRNVEFRGLDIDADFKKGMKRRSEATGLFVNGATASITGTINIYGTWTGVHINNSKGVDLTVTTENVETAAVVDGKVTVPGGGYGGKGVQTFWVRA